MKQLCQTHLNHSNYSSAHHKSGTSPRLHQRLVFGAVNKLGADVAAAVAERDRHVSGLQRSIAVNEVAIKEAQATILANGKAITVAAAAKADIVALGKMFGV